jgi:predicted dehydrogenase
MKGARRLGVAIFGVGHVAEPYVRQMRRYKNIRLTGVASRTGANARAFASRVGLPAYASLDELLADPAVDIVVNLCLPTAHAAITTRCLRAGKHVHSEKPLAMTPAEARRLVTFAKRRGLRLSSAPATFLGEAHQTAAKLVREGRIGRVRVVYAEVNHGRIERYHPAPAPFFAVGPLWDVAVYPLTALTAIFGPVRRVCCFGRLVLADRVAKAGLRFRIKTPDFTLALLEFKGGPLVRLTANFYVDRAASKGGGSIEYHGDNGRIWTGDFQSFDTPVECAVGTEKYQRVPLLRRPFPGVEFARGVEELAEAIIEDRPHRCTAGHAAHVVEVVEALQRSIEAKGRSIAVTSGFSRPAPMSWAV